MTKNKTEEIRDEIAKVIVGKDQVIAKVLMAILAGGHVLLEDVPGVGKTTLVLAFNKVLGLDYKRVQFTPDTLPADIIGFSLYDSEGHAFTYKEGPVMTNLLMADEINRTSAKTQAALLEVMEEKKVTVDGKTHPLPQPFIVLATQNPVGSIGTQMLPASQLDRFMIRLRMGYPDFESQVNILRDRHLEDPLDTISAVVKRDDVLHMQEEVNNVYIEDSIYEYVTRLSEATREHKMIELGLSPRAALALCQFSKAAAYLQDRNYVIPEDIRAVFIDVTAHRLILSRQARLSDLTSEDILQEILDQVDMPAFEIERSEA